MGLNGTGKLIKKSDLNKSLKLREFTFEKFRHMCILSGCDYASSVKGIGLQRAKKIVQLAGDKGMKWALHNIREILNMPSLIVPEGYLEKFTVAENISNISQYLTHYPEKWFHSVGITQNEYFLPVSFYTNDTFVIFCAHKHTDH